MIISCLKQFELLYAQRQGHGLTGFIARLDVLPMEDLKCYIKTTQNEIVKLNTMHTVMYFTFMYSFNVSLN